MKNDLLEALIEERDERRVKMEKAKVLVKWKDIPWETNRQGKMKWYLHPHTNDTVNEAYIVYMQEIPPGSRSGKQKMPGGIVHYILEGKGYSLVNKVKHDWKAGDVVGLPYLPEGLEYQHFNSDAEKPVIFVAVLANFLPIFGLDMGSGFEQLEACPEYRAEH